MVPEEEGVTSVHVLRNINLITRHAIQADSNDYRFVFAPSVSSLLRTCLDLNTSTFRSHCFLAPSNPNYPTNTLNAIIYRRK
mmetsp:Transcript_7580/g.10982  ORF Transcript_7580/g.10982 Transcript_7580/m.10982 type:complete len:82 (+) Transcript_7580:1013-1258(+)